MQEKELRQAIEVFLDLTDETRENLISGIRHQKRIREQVAALKQEAINCTNKITELQRECPHFNAVETPKADTGNWSKSDDRYWTEFRCPDCGKIWIREE